MKWGEGVNFTGIYTLNVIPQILRIFNICHEIILVTNSPQKIEFLKKMGINIAECKTLVTNINKLDKKAKLEYEEKVKKLGHSYFNL
ncbi:MAG TPA: hypothetical protein VHB48_01275 [Chitinophagaceae bacterium]|nr:hypothetical protein [Chitinophagaceae bacterium]